MFVIENLIIFVMNLTAQVFINFSIILAINGRSEIGLKIIGNFMALSFMQRQYSS